MRSLGSVPWIARDLMQWPVAMQNSGAFDIVIQSVVSANGSLTGWRLMITGASGNHVVGDHGRSEGRAVLDGVPALLQE